jgi:hypothetical protein
VLAVGAPPRPSGQDQEDGHARSGQRARAVDLSGVDEPKANTLPTPLPPLALPMPCAFHFFVQIQIQLSPCHPITSSHHTHVAVLAAHGHIGASQYRYCWTWPWPPAYVCVRSPLVPCGCARAVRWPAGRPPGAHKFSRHELTRTPCAKLGRLDGCDADQSTSRAGAKQKVAASLHALWPMVCMRFFRQRPSSHRHALMTTTPARPPI